MFMYRYFNILLLVVAQLYCVTTTSFAQVSIIMYPLPQQQLKPADMFRADVLNAGNASEVYFIGTIVQNGQKVVSAKSKVITLNAGSTHLSESVLSPEYTFFSSAVEQTGNLPYGNYNVCLKAYLLNGVEEAAVACEDIELMPLSPPMLLNPENQASIIEEYPLLVWLPPMPVGKEKVVYDLKLVEMTPNQTAYDAIQRNFALLEQKNITGTSLQYLANAMKLEVGKKYAWKVTAYTADRKLIGETEVWWFTRTNEEPKQADELSITKNFVKLKPNLDSYYVIVQDELKIIYEEKFTATKVKVVISDMKGKKIEELSFLANEMGDNPFVINLGKIGGMKNKQFYILEASAPDRPKQYLMFKNIK